MGWESAHTATALYMLLWTRRWRASRKAISGPDRPNCSWTDPVLCGRDRRIAEQCSADLSLCVLQVCSGDGWEDRVISVILTHESCQQLEPSSKWRIPSSEIVPHGIIFAPYPSPLPTSCVRMCKFHAYRSFVRRHLQRIHKLSPRTKHEEASIAYLVGAKAADFMA